MDQRNAMGQTSFMTFLEAQTEAAPMIRLDSFLNLSLNNQLRSKPVSQITLTPQSQLLGMAQGQQDPNAILESCFEIESGLTQQQKDLGECNKMLKKLQEESETLRSQL